jgi:ABC-type multidrug transport system ATPase subunit
MMVAPILEMKNVSKHFGVTAALSDVSFEMFPGEIHALVGENGAGKSTLIKAMTGIHQPSSGEIWVDGSARILLRRRKLLVLRQFIKNLWFFQTLMLPKTSSLITIVAHSSFSGTTCMKRLKR